jgi:hypothetical protein
VFTNDVERASHLAIVNAEEHIARLPAPNELEQIRRSRLESH